MSQLLESAKNALIRSAILMSATGTYSERGYAVGWKENLMSSLPFGLIESDLSSGAGGELKTKFLAAYSSSALAVNSFGYFRALSTLPPLGGSKLTSMRFEGRCPTGLGGTPPHLDVLMTGPGSVVGIESKCTEWMSSKEAKFNSSYDSLAYRCAGSGWFELIEPNRLEPKRYKHLDVAQLVKHALGLMTCFPTGDSLLLYLYWEPHNHDDWKECERHRSEISDLQHRVKGSRVRFDAMSYQQLWNLWFGDRFAHPRLEYLQRRYAVRV